MKNTILYIFLCSFLFSFAQKDSIQEVTLTEKDKVINAFAFQIPVCRSNVLIKEWNSFVKERDGKLSFLKEMSGGSNAKNFHFKKSIKPWLIGLKYTFRGKDSMIVYNFFKSETGEYLTKSDISEYTKAIHDLDIFKYDLKLACTNDDIELSEKYLKKLKSNQNSLLKKIEKLNSTISKLEVQIPYLDSTKTSYFNSKELKKHYKKTKKAKKSLLKNKANLEKVTTEKDKIIAEIPNQEKVVDNFKERLEQIIK